MRARGVLKMTLGWQSIFSQLGIGIWRLQNNTAAKHLLILPLNPPVYAHILKPKVHSSMPQAYVSSALSTTPDAKESGPGRPSSVKRGSPEFTGDSKATQSSHHFLTPSSQHATPSTPSSTSL